MTSPEATAHEMTPVSLPVPPGTVDSEGGVEVAGGRWGRGGRKGGRVGEGVLPWTHTQDLEFRAPGVWGRPLQCLQEAPGSREE